jgi:ABC-type glycerol-3-phosphate transport system substrate-binding protein
MKKTLLALMTAMALAGCGNATNTTASSVPNDIPSSTTVAIPPTSTTNLTTTTTSQSFNESQLSQLESSVNNAQSLLDQTDQLAANN